MTRGREHPRPGRPSAIARPLNRYDDAGNPWVLRHEDWYNVRVDMPDMRAFHDMWWMTRHKGPPCPPRVPACDLNGDGHVGEEPYPRIACHGQTPDDRDLGLLIARASSRSGGAVMMAPPSCSQTDVVARERPRVHTISREYETFETSMEIEGRDRGARVPT